MNAEQVPLIRWQRPRQVDRWNMIFLGLPLAAFELVIGSAITAAAVNLVPMGIDEIGPVCCGRHFGILMALLIPCLAAGWGLDAFLTRQQWPHALARLSLVAANTAWIGTFVGVGLGGSFLRG